MERAFRGRGLRAGLALVAASAAGLMAAGASASAATHTSPPAPNACTKFASHVRMGHFSGIVRAVPTKASHNTSCGAHITSDAANGTPPLIWHGGPVMGTRSTGPVVITPIFWNPSGHPMSFDYKKILLTYLFGVALSSGQHTNVYSTLNEYSGSNGNIRYRIALGLPVNDTNPLPADGCTVDPTDNTGVYADNTGYNACLDDNQVIAETDSIINARHMPRDFGHIYVLYLPKGVESCFFAGSTTTSANVCTINHQPSAAYCAYHNFAPSGAVYANMPYPIYASPIGFTCGSDARFPTVQTPNGNADADTEISPTSHEVMESITDPDTVTGWYDSSGFENGDECAYVFGPTQGTTGALYNQVIFHHHYLTQEEFSNNDFAHTGLGCLQSE